MSDRQETWSHVIAFCAIILVLLGNGSLRARLISEWYANAGSIRLAAALTSRNLSILTEAERFLNASLEWNGGSTHVARNLGRIAYEETDYNKARNLLQSVIRFAPDDVLAHMLLADVYDSLGDAGEAVREYELAGYRGEKLMVNLLALGSSELNQSNKSSAAAAFRRALVLDLTNLFALYNLLLLVEDNGEGPEVTSIYRTLEAFDLRPWKDPRLGRFAGQAMDGLITRGIWSRDVALNIGSYLVWQGFVQGTEATIAEMLKRNHTDADWLLLLGRLKERKGSDQTAKDIYEYVSALNPSLAEPYLRLGRLYYRQGDLASAIRNYCRYWQLAPNDLLVRKLLSGVVTYLPRSCGTVSVSRNRTDPTLTDEQMAGNLLGLAKEHVQLSNNLLVNGGFEMGGVQPYGWIDQFWVYQGGTYENAWFVGGRDMEESYEGHASLRIHGFWILQDEAKAPARLGYSPAQLDLKPETLYLLSFFYRTKDQAIRPGRLYICSPEESEFDLPDTGGEWWKAITVFKNEEPTTYCPRIWLQNRGVGDVWFDNVQVRSLNVPGSYYTKHSERFSARLTVVR